MCQSIILSKKGQTVITQCPDCKAMNIWQHNLLLNFTPNQFASFIEFTSTLDEEDALFPFPNGEERFVLRTPNSDICFTFSLDEWQNFNIAMDEADYMRHVYDMLQSPPSACE